MRCFPLPLLALLACQTIQTPVESEGPSLLPSQPKPAQQTRPNIVFIFSDDHAAHAIGAYGSRYPGVTPHIDRLAAEGVLLRNAFCGNSICSPSRATVLTGKHSHANGVRGNAESFDGSQVTFPKLLQGSGYQTAMLGKWHLKSDPTGFNHWQILPGQGRYYNPDFKTKDGTERLQGYVTDLITDMAVDWLEEDRDPDQPFLLMVQHKAPHRAWMPGPNEIDLFRDGDLPEPATLFDDYQGRAAVAAESEMTLAEHMWLIYDCKLYEEDGVPLEGVDRWAKGRFGRLTDAQEARWRAAYDAENAAFRANPPTGDDLVRWKYQRYIKDYLRCVAGVDKSVGRVMQTLKEQGLDENTLVIYSSDQGFYLGDHGWYDKRWMYEQSMRMPFVARWPGGISAGREEKRMVQNIDFAPTFLALAGVDVPEEMHGVAADGLLRGDGLAVDAGWRDAIYYRYTEFPQPHRVAPHFGVRTDRYKLICYDQADQWELFDLEADPDEVRSVYGDPGYADVQRGLLVRLDELRVEYGDLE